MIRFNAVGLGMLFGSAVIALLLSSILKSEEAVTVMTASSLMIVADLLYRSRQVAADGKNKWIAIKSGGFIGLGPAWMMGILLIVYAFVELGGITPQ